MRKPFEKLDRAATVGYRDSESAADQAVVDAVVQPRIQQFEITARCVNEWPHDPDIQWPDFPLCVWVYPNLKINGCHCGGKTFRIADHLPMVASNGDTYSVEAYEAEYFPAVCEHMGHLIE